MSSSMTPIGREPLTYSLQYPPWRRMPSGVGMNEKPLRGLQRERRRHANGGTGSDSERSSPEGDLRWLSVGVLELDLPPFVFLGVEQPEIVQVVRYGRE